MKIVMLGEGRTTLRIQLTVSSCWGANPWLHAGRVGKTSLVLRYCKDTFSDKQVSTIQASYLQKRLTLGSTTCNLAIWVRGAALFSLHCLQSRAVPVPAGYRRSRAIPCFGSDLLPRRRRYLRPRTLPSSLASFLPLALHLHTRRCSKPSPPSTNFPFQLPPCSCSHHCDHRRCLAATFGCLG